MKVREGNGLRAVHIERVGEINASLVNGSQSGYDPGADPKLGAAICDLKKKKGVRNADEMKKFIIPAEDGYQSFLEKEYIRIREYGFKDIPTIAKNTGLSEQDLIKLKEHVFMNTHKLSVMGNPLEEFYFQADSEIAYAWKRALEGDLSSSEKEWFEQLLNHELKESIYMKQGMPLRDPSTYGDKGFEVDPSKNAHDKANLTDKQPGDYPGHDMCKEYMEHMNDKID